MLSENKCHSDLPKCFRISNLLKYKLGILFNLQINYKRITISSLFLKLSVVLNYDNFLNLKNYSLNVIYILSFNSDNNYIFLILGAVNFFTFHPPQKIDGQMMVPYIRSLRPIGIKGKCPLK